MLAPGAVKLGSVNYWTLNGARELYNKVVSAKAVRFIVNTFTPVIGFQELAYAIKTKFPRRRFPSTSYTPRPTTTFCSTLGRQRHGK